MGRDNNDAHPGGLNPHLGQDIQTVVFTQAQVEKTQVEHLALQEGFGLVGVIGGGHAIAFVFQAITESAQDGRFVVYQQDTAFVLLG
ncbi:hypothetical protein D3C78_1304030 [compost metagenome]